MEVLGMVAEGTSYTSTKFPLVENPTNSWLNETSAKLLWQLNWEKISKVRQGHPYTNGENIKDAYW